MDKKTKIKNKLQIIKKIENIRKKNNVNWMNILRVAIKSSPEETMRIMKSIDKHDNRISKFFKKLGK